MELSEARYIAHRLLRYAADDGSGERALSDAVYRAVVEDRNAKAEAGGYFYSSCGDLAHWMLYRLGVRLPWVNRDENGGWRVAVNVSELVYGSRLARRVHPGDDFEPGDVLVVQVDDPGRTHVICVLEHGEGLLTSAEYGQPGGKVKVDRPVVERWGKLVVGNRTIDYVLPLDAVLTVAAAKGKLDEAETPDAWAARLHLPDTLPAPPPEAA